MNYSAYPPVFLFGLILFGSTFLMGLLLVGVGFFFEKKVDSKRILSQALLTIIVYFLLISPGIIFKSSVFVLIFFILRELLSYVNALNKPIISKMLSAMLLVAVPCFMLISFYSIALFPFVVILVFLSLIASVIFLCRFDEIYNALIGITMIFLILTSLSSILYLRGKTHGLELCLTVVFLTNISDAFALLGGTFLGKRQLLPEISPNKTVAGAVIGLLSTLMFAFIFNNFLVLGLFWWQIVIMGCVISISAQLGDLVASFAKRKAGIKDFGSALPGHGGVLDRCDSLIFSLPATILLLLGLGTI